MVHNCIALGDPDIRDVAARALGPSAADNADARDALLQALGDPDYHVRSAAARALGQSGAADSQTRSALLRLLRDSREPSVRHSFLSLATAVVNALVQPGKWAGLRSDLLRRQDDAVDHVRSAVALALGQSAPTDPEARAALLDALRDPAHSVRGAAAVGLRRLAAADPSVRAALLKLLFDPNYGVRANAALALGPAATADPDTRAALLKAFRDREVLVRTAAIGALTRSNVSEPEIRAALLKTLEEGGLWVSFEAVHALTRLGARLCDHHLLVALKVLLTSLHFSNDPRAWQVLRNLVDGRPLPGYRWVPLAERARRKRRWRLIRLGIYVVSFVLLAALGVTALADQLAADSILLKAGGISAIIVPTVVALMQLYDWVKRRVA